MGWPMLPTQTYPNAVVLCMDGLSALGTTRPGVPPNFDGSYKLIVVKRIGGTPDPDDVTDYPIMQIQNYAASYLLAADLAADVQLEILNWPLKQIGPNQILVDEAEIYVGEMELPDIYPDERRVVSTYRLGLRRQ